MGLLGDGLLHNVTMSDFTEAADRNRRAAADHNRRHSEATLFAEAEMKRAHPSFITLGPELAQALLRSGRTPRRRSVGYQDSIWEKIAARRAPREWEFPYLRGLKLNENGEWGQSRQFGPRAYRTILPRVDLAEADRFPRNLLETVSGTGWLFDKAFLPTNYGTSQFDDGHYEGMVLTPQGLAVYLHGTATPIRKFFVRYVESL